jgi:serine/threonine protein kinase
LSLQCVISWFQNDVAFTKSACTAIRNGIVHRDLKSQNILIDRRYNAKAGVEWAE